jgi:hypothetical protein
MEITYVCPTCHRQAIGVVQKRNGEPCICSYCLSQGLHIVMHESHKNDIKSVGNGLFVKDK